MSIEERGGDLTGLPAAALRAEKGGESLADIARIGFQDISNILQGNFVGAAGVAFTKARQSVHSNLVSLNVDFDRLAAGLRNAGNQMEASVTEAEKSIDSVVAGSPLAEKLGGHTSR